MNNIKFIIFPEAAILGVKTITAYIENVGNFGYQEGFRKFLEESLQNVRKEWGRKNQKDDEILNGFQRLHERVGRSNREYRSSPEALLSLFIEKNKFPRINMLVDIYNLVSLKSRLALGAHDTSKIVGNISLKLTTGKETFVPLGKSDSLSVFPNEYAYVDDENKIICRLEVLQCEQTKVTSSIKDVFLIVQGNNNTSDEYVSKTAKDACELITRFCGGNYRFLNSLK